MSFFCLVLLKYLNLKRCWFFYINKINLIIDIYPQSIFDNTKVQNYHQVKSYYKLGNIIGLIYSCELCSRISQYFVFSQNLCKFLKTFRGNVFTILKANFYYLNYFHFIWF